jgi:hypothetical protein
MQFTDAPLHKPVKAASQLAKAEYHRLSLQQIERFKISRTWSYCPDWLRLQINLQQASHKRLVKYHSSRAKLTRPAPVSAAQIPAVDLAINQASGVHPTASVLDAQIQHSSSVFAGEHQSFHHAQHYEQRSTAQASSL